MKAESRGEAEGHQGAREGRDGREARFGHIWPAQGPSLPDGIRTGPGSPESGSPCPGRPAAGTMHASGASGDGWRSRWETRHISLRGGHGACRQARRLLQRSRGAGASRMADPHGACRKVHCLAVCGDWGPPQNASGRISALVDMPIIPLGGIPCGREPASATLFIQRFPNRRW